MLINTFEELVELLRNNKYIVKITKYKNYKFANVTGKNIRGGFCTKSDYVYPHISDSICVDHVDCFDKWRKCPIQISLPLKSEILLEYMFFIGTLEGFKNSNSYDYLDNDLYPYKGENKIV